MSQNLNFKNRNNSPVTEKNMPVTGKTFLVKLIKFPEIEGNSFNRNKLILIWSKVGIWKHAILGEIIFQFPG